MAPLRPVFGLLLVWACSCYRAPPRLSPLPAGAALSLRRSPLSLAPSLASCHLRGFLPGILAALHLQLPSTASAGAATCGRGDRECGDKEAEVMALMEEAGAAGGDIAVRETEARGLGVVTTRDVGEGEFLLTVPLGACLLADRHVPPEEEERVLGRPRSEVSQPEALTWDVRLAKELLDRTSDSKGWWGRYRALLPDPGGLPQPLCLPEALASSLGHAELARGGRAQQDRLRMLFPALMPPEGPAGGGTAPLQWAFACVRSRAYACTPPPPRFARGEGGGGGTDRFGFVPFLDLINHGEEEEWGGGGDGDLANADCFVCPEEGAFKLYATRPILEGQEVLTCYKPRMDNRVMFALYGFVPQGGNPNDDLGVDFRGATAPLRELLRAARRRAPADAPSELKRRVQAVVSSVPTRGGPIARYRGEREALLEEAAALLEACEGAK